MRWRFRVARDMCLNLCLQLGWYLMPMPTGRVRCILGVPDRLILSKSTWYVVINTETDLYKYPKNSDKLHGVKNI